jgi:hypothetical protein
MFENKYIDKLIEDRKQARLDKDWELCDQIRNYLDTKYVFIFDTKEGQIVYNLFEKYFNNKNKMEITKDLNNRQYLEYKIKQDIDSEKRFDAWLFSVKKSINNDLNKKNKKC